MPSEYAPGPLRLGRMPAPVRGLTVALRGVARAAAPVGLDDAVGKLALRVLLKGILRPDLGGYLPGEHDVVVSPYSKSGTYWTLQLAHQITRRGAGDFRHVHDVVPWPDGPPGHGIHVDDPMPRQTSPTGLRVVKAHLPREALPLDSGARYVTVLRDPLDVLVSSWFFVGDVLMGAAMPSIEAWAELWCSSSFPMGHWPSHVAGWWAARDEPSVLVLRFEDLKRDLAGGVDALAAHLGVELSDEEHAEVVRRGSFEHMKGIDERFVPGPIGPSTGRDVELVRRGEAGSADELLDPATAAMVDGWCRDELARLGSDLPYDRWFPRDPAARTPRPHAHLDLATVS